jgi:hypothetical protein
MANSPKPDQPAGPERDIARGCNPLMLAILLLIAALVVYVGWIDNPVEAPNPAKTGSPAPPAPDR